MKHMKATRRRQAIEVEITIRIGAKKKYNWTVFLRKLGHGIANRVCTVKNSPATPLAGNKGTVEIHPSWWGGFLRLPFFFGGYFYGTPVLSSQLIHFNGLFLRIRTFGWGVFLWDNTVSRGAFLLYTLWTAGAKHLKLGKPRSTLYQ